MLRPNATKRAEEQEKQTDDGIKPPAPYKGHTWFLMSDDRYDLLRTPMGINSQTSGGDESTTDLDAAWRSWAVAAQQHSSLLINLERNQISRYFFGSPIAYPSGKNTKGSSMPTGKDNDTESA